MLRKDLSNQKFGTLTVLNYSHSDKNGKAYYYCLCDCGKITKVRASHLLSGASTTCGGVTHREKHGQYNKRIYNTYHHMIHRCYNSNNQYFHCYGGRGITVCDEWKNDFVSFYNWAVNNRYKDDLTIERVDVNGNYEPSNCTFIPISEQAKNRRIVRCK